MIDPAALGRSNPSLHPLAEHGLAASAGVCSGERGELLGDE